MTKSKVVIQAAEGWGKQPIYFALGSQQGPSSCQDTRMMVTSPRQLGTALNVITALCPLNPRPLWVHSGIMQIPLGCSVAQKKKKKGETLMESLVLEQISKIITPCCYPSTDKSATMSLSTTSTHLSNPSRGGVSTTCLCQGQTTLSVKKFFILSNLNLPW